MKDTLYDHSDVGYISCLSDVGYRPALFFSLSRRPIVYTLSLPLSVCRSRDSSSRPWDETTYCLEFPANIFMQTPTWHGRPRGMDTHVTWTLTWHGRPCDIYAHVTNSTVHWVCSWVLSACSDRKLQLIFCHFSFSLHFLKSFWIYVGVCRNVFRANSHI